MMLMVVMLVVMVVTLRGAFFYTRCDLDLLSFFIKTKIPVHLSGVDVEPLFLKAFQLEPYMYGRDFVCRTVGCN